VTEPVLAKFDRIARGYAEHDYADPVRYSARRARTIVELGPGLAPGQTVLDLGCADGNMAPPLTGYGLVYAGVDASAGMVEAARARNPGLPFEVSRSEDYAPPEPVDATICLRSFYYPADRVAFFRKVAGYTRVKFVFDFRPRDHPTDTVLADLRAAGFERFALRPFFLPQHRSLPGAVVPLVSVTERTGPVGRAATRVYGRMFCAATTAVRPGG
jgi:SAM-dependent methyltransferase